MTNTYLSYNNIISSLGFDSKSVVDAVENEISGLSKTNDKLFLNEPICSSIVSNEKLNEEFKQLDTDKHYTKLEKMMILSLNDIILKADIPLDTSTGLIISTTKGNIHALEKSSSFEKDRAYLGSLGKEIKDYFGFKNEAVVVSNACVSGLLAIDVAKKFIEQALYKNVFVVAGDLVSKFVLSGFKSFQALSSEPCKPYSANRTGINIGEVATSVLVTSDKMKLAAESVEILGMASSNDANHISGPSRTGEGLYRAINLALTEAEIDKNEIDYISAHGTATLFNDEMEAIAFNRLGLSHTPINSLKGYFGHTLGASGLLETVIGMHSLKRNKLFVSKGFDKLGVSKPINVIEKTEHKELNIFLKTSSGFGGSNTAGIFRKVI